MPRKSSVRVQMADEETELPSFEEILAQTPPRQPDPDDPDNGDENGNGPIDPREDDDPPPPEEPDVEPEPDIPDEGDPDEIPFGDESGLPADPPHIAAITEIFPPTHNEKHYEARISIVDAFQYQGNLKDAPEWIDRNWAAYADNYDPVRELEPGPALRVPTYRGDTVLCRKGDYVAQQEVRLTSNLPGEVKIEVWEQQQFERLFIPV